MNSTPSVWRRVGRYLAQTAVVLAILAFYAAYIALPRFQKTIDLFLDPAVAGITVGYSSLSSFVYRRTGLDLGLARPTLDPRFRSRVQFATWVNERKAGPLIDIAADSRYPNSEREAALMALLRF